MSDRELRVGLVCEGPTDLPILVAFLGAVTGRSVWPFYLQPQVDEAGKPLAGVTTGWCAVRTWCEQHCEELGEVVSPLVGEPLDLLVVALDLDIAVQAGITSPPKNLKAYDGRRLCNTIKSWLDVQGAKTQVRKRLPQQLVIAIPCMAIETWVITALFPKQARPESIRSPAEHLVDRGKLRRKTDGTPSKWLPAYQKEFAREVAAHSGRVRKSCSEAARFAGKVEALHFQ